MGNLLGSWRFKEPSTIEECDSTWGSDSEGEDPPAPENDSGISDSVSPADSDRAAGDASPQVPAARWSECGCVGAVVGAAAAPTRPKHRGGNRGPCSPGATCARRTHTFDGFNALLTR
ncbi:unnamed protein product [Tetraodon nigroviridis]|uniref:(spotted green pufferfish) hypothetical protein n=1 Tax=Tetraodon nigroviridis TaxID=99883 RepID=Q4SG60_TETNG|nr:unnamed protein product [Tetraodon nigroviridis]